MSNELIKELESIAEEYGFDIDELVGLEDVEIVEEGNWISEGKFEICETVLKYKEKFFSMMQSRSGSYWTDYNYNDPYFLEVEPKVITKTVYERVRKNEN